MFEVRGVSKEIEEVQSKAWWRENWEIFSFFSSAWHSLETRPINKNMTEKTNDNTETDAVIEINEETEFMKNDKLSVLGLTRLMNMFRDNKQGDDDSKMKKATVIMFNNEVAAPLISQRS